MANIEINKENNDDNCSKVVFNACDVLPHSVVVKQCSLLIIRQYDLRQLKIRFSYSFLRKVNDLFYIPRNK